MDQNKTVLLQVIMPKGTQTHDLTKSEFVLGRGETSEVPIPDQGISREHLRVNIYEGFIRITDLNSSNGTFVNGVQIQPNLQTDIREDDTISFGKSVVKVKLRLYDMKTEIKNQLKEIEKTDVSPIHVDVSAFPKTQNDFKQSFKNVGLDLPKHRSGSEQAAEIVKEAEYIKHSIIKSAEAYKAKLINETKIQTRQASEEAYAEYQRQIDLLLDDTRRELLRLKTETEILLDEKRMQANEEIENLWKDHRELIRKDKEKVLDSIEKENKIKLDLSIEKMKSDMFSERHRLITEAENEIIQKKRIYQIDFENEKAEHLARIKKYTDELTAIQANLEECQKAYKQNKELKEASAIELTKLLSQVKIEKENLDSTISAFKDTMESHQKIENELAHFAEIKQTSKIEQEQAEKKLEELNRTFSNLSEKKQEIETQIATLSTTLDNQKLKAKADVEAEYRQLKMVEAKKFEDFKANELKELQKVRDSHTNAIKKFSVDLSQEIATKIEMLAKSNPNAGFNFEKYFELINSVIQVKSAINTGSESKHAEQLDSWKKRKRKENMSLLTQGFAAGFAFVFIGNVIYKKLNTDPVQEQLAKIASERKQNELENMFVPTKTDKYYDNYVESTLYTENFTETFLNDENQQEWVNYATKYFLRQWKIEEEKVIQVISNSKALVQNVVETAPTIKKNRLKTDIEKLKATENKYVQQQVELLGTNVKYEVYKKLEKDFFQAKMQGRAPASK